MSRRWPHTMLATEAPRLGRAVRPRFPAERTAMDNPTSPDPTGGVTTEDHEDVGVTPGTPARVGDGQEAGGRYCSNCGVLVSPGARTCASCRHVLGLAPAIVLSPRARRLGEYLLDGVLMVVTLGIGWVIWALIVFKDGQTPAKQLLGMRAVSLSTMQAANWGTTAIREVCRIVLGYVAAYTVIGWVLLMWLLWDRDNQELWDKLMDTVVVNDPDNTLLVR